MSPEGILRCINGSGRGGAKAGVRIQGKAIEASALSETSQTRVKQAPESWQCSASRQRDVAVLSAELCHF